jgi:signal transduction histidine kinase
VVGKKRSSAPQESRRGGNDLDAGRDVGPEYVLAPPAAGGGGWRLRNWRLRYKMAAVLLVPTLAAIGVGGIRVYDGLSTANQFDSLVQEVDLAQRAAAVAQELQTERDDAVVVTSSDGTANVGAYNAQTAAVDTAVAKFLAIKPASGNFAPLVQNAFNNANTWLNSLGALRNAVKQGFTEPAALTDYDAVINSVLDINRETANAAADTQVNRTAQAAEAISSAKEQLAQERSLLLGAALRGSFLDDQADEMRAVDARFTSALAQFQSVASPAQQLFYSARVAGGPGDRTAQLQEAALIAASTGKPLGVDPTDWGAQSSANANLVRDVEQQLLGEFHTTVSQDATAARWAAIRDGALIVVFLLLAISFATYIARSMLRPLRTLQSGALDIAQKELPEAIRRVNDDPAGLSTVRVAPVPVYTNEEIGQVARSFDAVHQQALRLASEQALLRNNVNDLFVNLARRSQTLVQRQLSLIDRLEQDEQDPDQLGSLFELDHLATRMRRNNENLLILGGTELTRRMMRPVPLAEVIGAAVSEVEQYARVAVADSPELAVQGRVVNDFVHLVAELLENATVFSNPDTEVSVRTAYRRQELVLEIRDRGVGIDADQLGEINERLVRPPEIDVAVSRRMGLYVVGQLARRHNIRVELQNNEDLEGGVTASVHLSGEYVAQLTPSGPVPMPDAPRPFDQGRDSVSDSGAHVGLAAAFPRSGLGAPSDHGAPEPVSSHAQPEPPLPMGRPADEVTEAALEADPLPTETGASTDFLAHPSQYSIRVAEGDSLGAAEIPPWADTAAHQASGYAPIEANGVSYSPAPSGAHAWSEDSDPESPESLFQSPYEAEKTAQFESLGSSVDWGAQHSARGEAPDEPSHGHLAEPEAGTLGYAAAGREMDDAPTQRLPIYEAVLSQWFRESDDEQASVLRSPLGATSEMSTGAAWDGQRAEPPVAEPTGAHSTSGIAETEDPGSDDSGRALRRDSATAPESNQDDHEQQRNGSGTYDPGWGYADQGWQAAEALVRQSMQAQETTTAAGLPKRVPRSNLVPGSPMARPETAAHSKPVQSRSADAVRGRMSNFQQGIRRGRHAKAEPAATEEVPLDSEPS